MQAPSTDLRMAYTRGSYPEICMWLAQGDNTTDPGWGVLPACQWLVPYTNHLYHWCIQVYTLLILNTLYYMCCFWTLLRFFSFNLHPGVGGNSRSICDCHLDWAFLRLSTANRRGRRCRPSYSMDVVSTRFIVHNNVTVWCFDQFLSSWSQVSDTEANW